MPRSNPCRLCPRQRSWLLAVLVAVAPTTCPAQDLAPVDRQPQQSDGRPGYTAWLNASALCDPEVVCVVEPGERWLISSSMTVDALHIKGFLKWDDTVPDIVLTAGWIYIDEGATFQVGTEIEPIGWHPGVTASIYIKKSAINRHHHHGYRFLTGNGGTVKMYGMPKLRTWDLLSRPVTMGSRELALKHDPLEMVWRIGDEVGIATTSVGYSTKHRIVAVREATDEQLVVASASAGKELPDLPAANTIDGNVGSLWSSWGGGETDQWVRLDLVHTCDITRVRFHFQEPRHAPNYTVDVLTSNEGKWIKAAQVNDGLAGWREVHLDQKDVVAIRMVADYASMDNRGYRGERGYEPAWSGLWLNEVQVFGIKAGETKTMPTVIVLDTPVEADHMGSTKHFGGHDFEMAAEVVNLERSILITGDHDDIHETHEGFSTVQMNGGLMDIRYTRVEHCGRRDMMGKYCLHFHRMGRCHNCTFQGNAVVDSQQVGITIHDTHNALVDQNVLWDARGAGIHVEDGNEMDNTFSRNVVICSHHSVCAVPWLGKPKAAGFYVVGMTNDFLYNRVAGYSHCFYASGFSHPYGCGYAWGKVCPRHLPFGRFEGNVNHDCSHYGLYLDHQYPRNVVRDENGYVTSGCEEFTDDGKDNGLAPANVIEDQFEWHNTFIGQYMMGDVSYLRYKSMNNGHSMYWKASKNFADGVSHHMRECIFANDPHDPIGVLQIFGPSGPFAFKFTDNVFVGGPVGFAALCAGQHCGMGGSGGPCNVEYLMQNISWSGLMDGQKKIQFGVHSLPFGYVQPILLTKDNFSLGGFRSMVSRHLNGFKALHSCEQQGSEWDSGIACDLPIRRLNFWSNADEGNVTLSGPGYDVEPNFADPVEGENAGLMTYEPMHRGYGLPVVAGARYSVSGSFHGDVAVEFSDREVADYFGIEQDELTLDVIGGSSCDLTSNDPRNYLSPLGTSGQAEGVQLEEVLNCMIQPRKAIVAKEDVPEPEMEQPDWRLHGTCDFSHEPDISYHWDPHCVFGGLGCFADDKNPECGFCGRPPFKDCVEATSPTMEATSTTISTSPSGSKNLRGTTTTMEQALGTTTPTPSPTEIATPTTTMLQLTGLIQNQGRSGYCLSGEDLDGGKVEASVEACSPGSSDNTWTFEPSTWMLGKGIIKTEHNRCLDSPDGGTSVHLWWCWGSYNQMWSYHPDTDQIKYTNDKCLIGPSDSEEDRRAVLADCDPEDERQKWGIGSSISTTTIQQAPETTPVTVVTTTPTPTEVTATPTAMEEASATLTTTTPAVPTSAEMATPTTTMLRLSGLIQNQGLAGYCLIGEDLDGGKVEASAKACSPGSSDNKWTFEPSTWLSGKGIIKTEHNRCLDSPQGGNLVHLWWCWGSPNQMWSYHPDTDQIKHTNEKCLTGPSDSDEDRRAVLADCDPEDERQKWGIEAP